MRSKDLQKREDQRRIAESSRFVVTYFTGRAPGDFGPVNRAKLWVKREFKTLNAARAHRNRLGVTDQYGRRAIIYAISKEGYSIHVED